MTFLNIAEELKYQQIKFEVTQKLQSLISKKGYINFEPSFFEDYESFVLKNKRVKKEKMIKLIDADGRILVLRPDITTSLMRQIMPRFQDDMVLKIFYNASIFSKSSINQIDIIRQFGVEFIGEENKTADLEIINMASSIFNLFNLEYMIEISDTRILESIMDAMSLNELEQNEFKDILYRKSMYDLRNFIENKPMIAQLKEFLYQLFSFQGNIDDLDKKLNTFKINGQIRKAFDDLKERIKSIADQENVMIDLSLVSTYDYYDGILFKGYIKGSKEEVLSGGRYDPLTESYGRRVPAIGFTLNTQEIIKEVLTYE
jgi:ATP phosphoribosyltransferase regulatory subunit